MKLFGELSKVEPQDDGTIKVWGYASSAEKDSDGEIVEPQAIKAAIPDYMKFGAVREMHKASAAGTAIEIDVQEDGRTFFGAHIVDPVAIKKVLTGVYKGFSIGGSILKRDTLNRTLIKAIKLTEISLVDRPANPEAVFTMCKMDDGEANENVEKAEGEVQEDKSTEATESDNSSGEPTEPKSEPESEPAEKSEFVDDLEKAGAKFSAKTKEALIAAQNAIKACLDALGSLGLDETEKSESVEDLTKVEALEKLTKLEEENKLLKADVENLTAENALLKSQPETPKGVLKVVEKTDDVQSDIVQKSDDKNLPPEGTEERAMYEMRKVFKTGGLRQCLVF